MYCNANARKPLFNRLTVCHTGTDCVQPGNRTPHEIYRRANESKNCDDTYVQFVLECTSKTIVQQTD